MSGKSGITVKMLLSAIRRKCLDCAGGNREEVEKCLIAGCPLYPFRQVVEQAVFPGISAAAENKFAGAHAERTENAAESDSRQSGGEAGGR